ncbi:hypothetical protein GCM10010254_24650 [Streptomyces chromofuscus]|nr:hypothetical protein GCM10010254_24650 [Streptomyces chromofuscus]
MCRRCRKALREGGWRTLVSDDMAGAAIKGSNAAITGSRAPILLIVGNAGTASRGRRTAPTGHGRGAGTDHAHGGRVQQLSGAGADARHAEHGELGAQRFPLHEHRAAAGCVRGR